MEDITYHFTYAEYLDRAINGKPGTKRRRTSRAIDGHHDASWSGTANWSEAVQLATEGWSEGRNLIGDIVDKLGDIEAHMVTLPQPINDVSGDYVDIGAYLEGIPENMVRWEEQESPKRVARILYNCSVSGGVSTEAIRWRGATVLALIDRLEAQGIRVELDMVAVQKEFSNICQTFVTLKEAGEPLHLDRLAFHLVHPASYRRINFSCWETYSAKEVNHYGFYVDGGYGTPTKIRKPEGYDLMIPEMYLGSVEDSVREIETMFDVVCDKELV